MNRILSGALALVFSLAASFAAHAQPLVDVDWVAGNLDNEHVVLIDLRNKIDGGSYDTYLEGHIPSSIHSDYLKDGWRVGRDDVVGLLPEAGQFEALARRLGGRLTAMSCWCRPASGRPISVPRACLRTFKVFGHENVSILDGGFAAWKAAHPAKIESGAPVALALEPSPLRSAAGLCVDRGCEEDRRGRGQCDAS